MRKQQKQILAFALILVFIGIVMIPSSRGVVFIENDDKGTDQDGVKYIVSGNNTLDDRANVTRNYKNDEYLYIYFTHAVRPPAPDILAVDFLIVAPDERMTNITYFMTGGEDPNNPNQFLVVVTEVKVYDPGALVFENKTNQRMAGRVIDEGNYTLVYIAGLPKTPTRSMSLCKITYSKEYPYTYMLPLGSAFAAVGVVLCVWSARSTGRDRTDEKIMARK